VAVDSNKTDEYAAKPSQPIESPAVASSESVWNRVKQHKVVQWVLAYAALAYTLLHGSEMLAEALNWPHGWIRAFTLILIMGTPLVAVLAWYHGAQGHKRVRASELMIIAMLLALGGAFLWRDSKMVHTHETALNAEAQTLGGSSPPAPPESIAVLAFTDLSEEGNQGYFSDGIAEEILNALAHVKGLKVASRTSSFQFRKSDLGIPAIAQKLGVRHILEGSVRKAGNTVRVTTQLIDASTDKHLWSQTFDRPLTTTSLFGIQDEIADTVVDHLDATIGSKRDIPKPAATKADTGNLDAYDLYLKGRSLFIARSVPNLREAARLLQTAIAKDPKFARAWETLGAVFVVSGFWGVNEQKDYQAAALSAADTAIALDPNLSMAYAVRGQVQYNMLATDGKISWDQALSSVEQGITNDSQNATALLWQGGNFIALGFMDRAAEYLTHCLQIDPFYETCRRFLALTHLYSGRAEEALRIYALGLENGYVNSDAQFAPAALARKEPLGALGMLVQQYADTPQLIQPVYRSLTDPKFSEHDRSDALALLEKLPPNPDSSIYSLWLLKAYDKIPAVTSDSPFVIWARDDAAWLKSPARKQMQVKWRLPEYWRKHGFPPQCRALGTFEFECQ
jgi:TolB-like protein/tetratricopeptide (TPR) repeat protein